MDSSSDKKEELRQQLRQAALEYHQFPRPGKISVAPTKGLLNQRMGLAEPEAFRWIQKASMDRRLTMAEVAQAVIEQLGTPKK